MAAPGIVAGVEVCARVNPLCARIAAKRKSRKRRRIKHLARGDERHKPQIIIRYRQRNAITGEILMADEPIAWERRSLISIFNL
jgi:hypothetical protein